jgi:hypothetical protein
MLLKLFYKIEREGMLSNSFGEDRVRTDKDTTTKRIDQFPGEHSCKFS